MMKKNNLILLFSFILFFSMFSYGNGLWTDLLELEGGTVIKFQFEITDDIHSEEPAVQMIPTELSDQETPAALPESITNEEQSGGSTENSAPFTDTDADAASTTNEDTNANTDAAENTNPGPENSQDHDQNTDSVSNNDSVSDNDSDTDSDKDTDSNSDTGNGFNE